MSDEQRSEEDLAENFRRLGENLAEAIRAAWDRPERRAVQDEIRSGLDELGRSVRQASDDFSESAAGRKLKTGVEDFRERVGERGATQAVRDDLARALSRLNDEIENLSARLRESRSDEDPSEGARQQQT